MATLLILVTRSIEERAIIIRFFLTVLLIDYFSLFFFNDTATTEIYTLSLHDALPICSRTPCGRWPASWSPTPTTVTTCRSEEHTSELQSLTNLVCRLLLEKKKKYVHRLIRHARRQQRTLELCPS